MLQKCQDDYGISPDLVAKVAVALDLNDKEAVISLTGELSEEGFDALLTMLAKPVGIPAPSPARVRAPQQPQLSKRTAEEAEQADKVIEGFHNFWNDPPTGTVEVVPMFSEMLVAHVAASRHVELSESVLTDAGNNQAPLVAETATPRVETMLSATTLATPAPAQGNEPTNGAPNGLGAGTPPPGTDERFLTHFFSLVEGADATNQITYLAVKRQLTRVFGNELFNRHRVFVQECLAALNDQSQVQQTGEEYEFDGDLITAKAAVAKARFEVESYKVYIRNRDRQLCRYIRKMQWPRNLKSAARQIEQILDMN